MKKKHFLFLFAILLLATATSCGNQTIPSKNSLKIGAVLYSDQSDPYVSLHIEAIKELQAKLGLKDDHVVIKTNVSDDSCFDSISELVESGYNMIFSVGNGFEDYMVQAAMENEKVHFCVANGTQAQTNGLSNLHSYFMKEFEARYVAGVAAGLKLKDMIQDNELSASDAIIGYVGEEDNPENISAYTAFYLGAKSVCPSARLKVKFADEAEDKDHTDRITKALIANGCRLISQQDISSSAASVCEENGVYYIGHIADASEFAPYYALTSSTVDWTEAYLFVAEKIEKQEELPVEWSANIKNDKSFVLPINEEAIPVKTQVEGINSALSEVVNQLNNQKIEVFDIHTFTVDGELVTSTAGEEFTELYHGTEYISDAGYFMENELSSYPKFEIKIDGIEILP